MSVSGSCSIGSFIDDYDDYDYSIYKVAIDNIIKYIKKKLSQNKIIINRAYVGDIKVSLNDSSVAHKAIMGCRKCLVKANAINIAEAELTKINEYGKFLFVCEICSNRLLFDIEKANYVTIERFCKQKSNCKNVIITSDGLWYLLNIANHIKKQLTDENSRVIPIVKYLTKLFFPDFPWTMVS